MHSWLLIVPLLAFAAAKPQFPGPAGLFNCNGKCDLPCSNNLRCATNVKALDKCGCCEVCVENENGTCGGPRNLFGVCGNGLICELMENIDVGKCKKKAPPKMSCQSLTCDHYQSCVMEGGVPMCKCVNDCDKDATNNNMQFCDVDGNEYQNLCEVRKKICESKRDFLYMPGKCQGCRDRGKMYAHATIVSPSTDKTSCQEDWCNHGSIITRMNKDCLKNKNYSCTIRVSSANDIDCPKGFSCLVTKRSAIPSFYPHLGVCKKVNEKKCYYQGKEYNLNKEFISEDCSQRCTCKGWDKAACMPLCPLVDIKCEDNEIKIMERRKIGDRHCKCDFPVCKKKEIICAMKMDGGPCYAYFRKWYFDSVKQECAPFIYGGCYGNENRFHTKAQCEKTCLSPSISLPIQIAPIAPKRSIKWPISKPPRPVLSNIQMTLKGKIKFNGVEKILGTPSCLFITLADISRMDVPAAVIKTKRFNLSGYDTSVDYNYEMTTLKPAEDQLWRTYAVSAVIHRNRCPEKRQSVKLGDFLTDTRHGVTLTKDSNSYEKDINVICYECKEGDDEKKKIVVNDKKPAVVPHPPVVKVQLNSNNDDKILKSPGCEFEGSMYKIDDEFMSSNCTSKCICDESNAISCVPLCSIHTVDCKDDERKVSMNQTVSRDSKCQCPFEYCLRKDVKDDDPSFKSMDLLAPIPHQNENYEKIIDEFDHWPINEASDDQLVPECMNFLTKELKNEGERWDEGNCKHCLCSNGSRKCTDDVCTKCPTLFVYYEPGKCCPVCIVPPSKNCFEKSTNMSREDGSSWKKDDCTSCLCKNGEIYCYGQDCPPAMCKNLVKKPGQCCPECLEEQCYDSTTKRTYKNNEMWIRPDGCTRCNCIGNEPMCSSPMCFLESCDDGVSHVTVPGICCPVCANKEVCRTNDGRAFLEGHFWHDESCEICSCTVNGIECTAPNFETENCTGRVLQLSKKCGKICMSEDNKGKENIKEEEVKEEEEKDEEVEEEELKKGGNMEEDIFP